MDESAEHEIDEAFEVSPEFGVETLNALGRNAILNCIKGHGMGFTVEDINDVYSQTMLEMFKAARKSGFSSVRSIRLALDIAEKRSKDMRKRRRLRQRREGAAFHDQLIEDLNGTILGVRAKHDPIDWMEFDKTLWQCIEELPRMQKVAATCFVDVYVEVRERNSYGPLAEAMGEFLETVVTVVAAKSAWYEAQTKIAEDLGRRGFNLLIEAMR